jgi:hypothetical protein
MHETSINKTNHHFGTCPESQYPKPSIEKFQTQQLKSLEKAMKQESINASIKAKQSKEKFIFQKDFTNMYVNIPHTHNMDKHALFMR